MKDAESQAVWIVCPMCDEKKCVGRYICPKIKEYLSKKKPKEETNDSV